MRRLGVLALVLFTACGTPTTAVTIATAGTLYISTTTTTTTLPYLAQMVGVADFLDGVVDLYDIDRVYAMVDYGDQQRNALAWGYGRCGELNAAVPGDRMALVEKMVSSDLVYEMRINVRLLVLAIEHLCPAHSDLLGK